MSNTATQNKGDEQVDSAANLPSDQPLVKLRPGPTKTAERGACAQAGFCHFGRAGVDGHLVVKGTGSPHGAAFAGR